MPPRYAYWTILVDDQPTAFRAAQQDDLMPTFKRLMQKHPSAKLVWFQNGKIWPSRLDAQEAMRARGEMGRRGDERQGGFRDRKRPNAGANFGSSERERAPRRDAAEKLEWKPKGEFTPAPKRADRPEWKPRGKDVGGSFSSPGGERRPHRERDERREWKPTGSFNRERKSEWKPKGSFDRARKPPGPRAGKPSASEKLEWKPRGAESSEPASPRARRPSASEKLEWKPRGADDSVSSRPASPRARKPSARFEPVSPQARQPGEKRKWIPKEEYKKSKGIERPRDSKWRPGGEHRDPKQKYKDAKKAKWTRFKQTIRKKWETRQGTPPGKKRRDEE